MVKILEYLNRYDYSKLIKAILTFETGLTDTSKLEEIYQIYLKRDISLLSDELLDLCQNSK